MIKRSYSMFHDTCLVTRDTRGITLIEVILSVALITILFSGILLAYFSVLSVIKNSGVREEALSLVVREIEIVRDLPYDQVGTVGGIPSGILLQQKTVSSTVGTLFTITTSVRNIDDPYDGTLGGTPSDTAPADYKLVEFQIACNSCSSPFPPLVITTTVAPKNLESSSATGSLFVNVFDTLGHGVSGATINVVNASVTPAINLTDTTNQNGILQLVGVSTSTQGYHITVTKSGYSSDQTYKQGDPANPNPLNGDATVAQGVLTPTSFTIDRVSTIRVNTKNLFCAPIPNRSFTMQGARVIGAPNVLKFSTSSATDSQGHNTFSSMESDTYTMAPTGSGYDLVGALPLSPLIVNPSSSVDFSFILTTSSPNSLLVTVRDGATSQGVASATVTLSKTGFSQTATTGRNVLKDTDWSGGNYASQSGTDPDSSPGTVSMLAGPGGYSTTTASSLVSRTFDTGSSTSNYWSIAWNPTSEPPQTGSGSIKFQIASNNDQATWSFVGPDGTAATYYTSPSSSVALAHAGNRYLRYTAYLSTQDSSSTPTLDDIAIEFSGACLPPSQAFFSSLTAATYSLDVSAPGYQVGTSSVAVGAGTQEAVVNLSP